MLEEELEKYKVDIAAIQEVRWKSTEIVELKKYVLINSGNKRNECGTGFMISKKLKGNIIGYILINERICTIELEGDFLIYPVLSVHAPSEEKDDAVKDAFYVKLGNMYNQTPRNDVRIILGDFNAKIDREELYKPVIGEHSKHNVSNSSGVRVIDFAAGKNMRLCSTYFPHRNIHK
jgi:exonuclease III